MAPNTLQGQGSPSTLPNLDFETMLVPQKLTHDSLLGSIEPGALGTPMTSLSTEWDHSIPASQGGPGQLPAGWGRGTHRHSVANSTEMAQLVRSVRRPHIMQSPSAEGSD